jgi:hypothetical protein
MGKWRYEMWGTTGRYIQTSNGPVDILQALNVAGQQGGELVTVIVAGSNNFEWVIKFPA